MVIVESGESVKMAIIDTEDVVMVTVDTSSGLMSRWTLIMEDTKQEDMVIEHSGGEPVEMDLMYGSGVMMVSEECKEETMNLVGGHLPDVVGSMVGVESYIVYPHHCGSVHTPLLSPATITENGVELGCVIGLHTTGDHEEVAKVMKPEDDRIKYSPGLEFVLPSYTFVRYNAAL
jgi:hypothetical protein